MKPQLNQIRTWVRQGRTDAWIAHQLEVSVSDIRSFKREHGLAAADAPEGNGDAAPAPVTGDEELDLRAEDDALVAAALEAEQAAEEEPEDEDEDEVEAEAEGEGDDEDKPKRRRRGRRGGRGRGKRPRRELEGTFDHGDEGYGLWLDPAVQDDPVYAEHWAGHRPVNVVVEAERIVITRAGADGDGNSDDSDD